MTSGPYSDWNVLMFSYAERTAEKELARTVEIEKRRPTKDNSAIVGWYKGVLYRIRLARQEAEEGAKYAQRW